jgi:hypothetical protein
MSERNVSYRRCPKMRISAYVGVAFAASSFPLASVYAQATAPLRQCIPQCIDQSRDEDHSLTDIKCLCQESDGGSLHDVLTCMGDKGFSINKLLSSLQAACELAGVLISLTALGDTGGRSSSLPAQPTVTSTRSITIIAPSPISPGTASTPATCTTTDTVSQTVAGGTLSQGYTSIISSAYTTTDLAGGVKTRTASYMLTGIQTQSSSSSASDGSGSITGSVGSAVSESFSGGTTATTTVGAETAASSASKMIQTGSAQSPDSAPFQMQGTATKVTSNWMRMTVIVWGVICWFHVS